VAANNSFCSAVNSLSIAVSSLAARQDAIVQEGLKIDDCLLLHLDSLVSPPSFYLVILKFLALEKGVAQLNAHQRLNVPLQVIDAPLATAPTIPLCMFHVAAGERTGHVDPPDIGFNVAGVRLADGAIFGSKLRRLVVRIKGIPIDLRQQDLWVALVAV